MSEWPTKIAGSDFEHDHVLYDHGPKGEGQDAPNKEHDACSVVTGHREVNNTEYKIYLERCPSGRRSTPGKCVYRKVSRVRIPLSPP